MADDDNQGAGEQQQERTVSYARFKEVNDKLAAERQARADLEDRIGKLEDADKPHLERLTKDLESAKKRADEAEQRAAQAETARTLDQKQSWLAQAAAKANFHNPGAAAAFANLDEIETSADAEKAVKQIAKSESYLVKAEDAAAGKLQRVGIAGTDGAQQGGQAATLSQEDLARQWGEQMYKGLMGEDPQPTAAQ